MNVRFSNSRSVILPLGLLLLLTSSPLKAQDFSLCSVVDTKHNVIMLGWDQPSQPVTGYSFKYNTHELTPYRATIDNPNKRSFQEQVGFGRHLFQVYGFQTDLMTNEVRVHIRRPFYFSILIPGMYQALHRNRYVSSCNRSNNFGSILLGVTEPLVLFAATGIAVKWWIDFFGHKNAALNARDTYSITLREEEFLLWQSERAKAKEIFPQALTLSIATLSVNALTAILLSPRGRAKIKGGFSLDCGTSVGSVDFCMNF